MNVQDFEKLGKIVKEHIDGKLATVEEHCSHIPILTHRIGDIEEHLRTQNSKISKNTEEIGDLKTTEAIQEKDIHSILKNTNKKDDRMWRIITPIITSLLTAAIIGGILAGQLP